MTLLQAPPTPDELIALKVELGLSAARMADLFGLGDGRRWRQIEAGDRRMSAARWSLGLLALGRHPTHKAVPRGVAEFWGELIPPTNNLTQNPVPCKLF